MFERQAVDLPWPMEETTFGITNVIRTPMMRITARISMSVKPALRAGDFGWGVVFIWTVGGGWEQ